MSDHPIYSEEAEKSMIGCIVQGEGGPLDILEITPDHFFHFANRTIAEAAMRLHKSGAPVNMATVTQAIPHADLMKIGGYAYVTESCFYPSPRQAPHFLAILDAKLRLRKAQELRAWLDKGLHQDADPDAISEGLRKRVTDIELTTSSENILPTVITSIRGTLEKMKDRKFRRGIETPWNAWNVPFGGLNNGKMYVLAGRPGTGKTAMMEEMAGHAMAMGYPVLIFEKDMSPETLIERMACRLVGLPHYLLEKGLCSPEQISKVAGALDILERVPLHLYNPAQLTAEKLSAITRRAVRQHGIKAVFLDHIQTLKVGKEIREGLTAASMIIRDCVTTTNVPMIILAHLNRDSVSKAGAKPVRPRPEDIKEFDQLYGDCDSMALLWSEQKPEDLEHGEKLEVNLFAAKNRGGPMTEEPLYFDRPMMHFSDRNVRT